MDDNTIIFDNVNFIVINDDIFNLASDILVVPARRQPCSGFGLDREIYKRAGKELDSARKKTLDVGEIEFTDAYDLKNYKRLCHIVPPAYDHEDPEQSFMTLRMCYEKCIAEAVKAGAGSITIPLFGSGALGFDPVECYLCSKQAILDAIKTYEAEILDITLVVYGNKADKISDIECLTARVVNTIRTERRNYIDEKPEMHSNKGYALNEIRNMIKAWINEEIELNENVNDLKDAVYDLSDYSKVSEKTIQNLIKENDDKKPLDDENKFASTPIPKRENRLALAIAMGLPIEQRIKLVLIDGQSNIYPANREEMIIEDELKADPEANVQMLEKAIAKKLNYKEYKLSANYGISNKRNYNCKDDDKSRDK